MSRDCIFITTTYPQDFILHSNDVFCDVVLDSDKINCYNDHGSFLLSSLSDDKELSYNDIKETMLLTSDPENLLCKFDEFYFYYGLILLPIADVNRFFIKLSDLVIMINWPNLIYFSKINERIKENEGYDWYSKEHEICIKPEDF